ncbi:MAG: hypothetical protein BWX80_03908 [Candidatus Hydrogenedentes bacterium ADurb.Bin101]|nr:MAG: hypothetical protein BWX80_03908 [Candidatus Hydrogenedentes bacterium ADurb.Bin101]
MIAQYLQRATIMSDNKTRGSVRSPEGTIPPGAQVQPQRSIEKERAGGNLDQALAFIDQALQRFRGGLAAIGKFTQLSGGDKLGVDGQGKSQACQYGGPSETGKIHLHGYSFPRRKQENTVHQAVPRTPP